MSSLTASTVEHNIGATGTVTIKVPAGGVTVQGVDGETVRLSSPNGHDLSDDYRIETGDGRLDLSVRDGRTSTFGWLSGRRFDPIHADIPRGAFLRLETASGSVHVDGLRGDQQYHAASGSIKLTDIAGAITVDHVSGDVKIRATGPVSLVARTVSGDVNAAAPMFERFQARTMSGSIRIAGRLADDGLFALDSVSGDVALELDGPARISGISLTGKIRTDLPHRDGGSPGRRTVEIGDGGPSILFKTVSGDLRVSGPKAPQAEPPADPATDGLPDTTLPDVAFPDAEVPDISAAATMPAAPIPPVPPTPPVAPIPPIPPVAPAPPEAPAVSAAPGVAGVAVAADAEPSPDALAARRMAILHELEHGRIEVDEASRRLAEVDADEDHARSHSRTFGIGPIHGELRWDHRA